MPVLPAVGLTGKCEESRRKLSWTIKSFIHSSPCDWKEENSQKLSLTLDYVLSDAYRRKGLHGGEGLIAAKLIETAGKKESKACLAGQNVRVSRIARKSRERGKGRKQHGGVPGL